MKKRGRIVTIGGGTGHFTLLTAVQLLRKEIPDCDVTAVVTATDSGGSSGRLRVERGMLPPGDINQCLLALSRSKNQEALIELLRRRFPGTKGKGRLGGHSVGNLLLTMLVEHTGDFMRGLAGMHQILDVDGEVLPVTLENVQLCAESERGTKYEGEANLDTRGEKALREERTPSPLRKVWLSKSVRASPLVLRRIRKADAIILGPGDLWTSILPSLLPGGMAEAMASSSATTVLITNIMTKFGETDGYDVQRFLTVVEEYLGKGTIDVALYNNRLLPKKILDRYAKEQRFPVGIAEVPHEDAEGKPRFVRANLASASTLARHDPQKLAFALDNILHPILC